MGFEVQADRWPKDTPWQAIVINYICVALMMGGLYIAPLCFEDYRVIFVSSGLVGLSLFGIFAMNWFWVDKPKT